MNSDYPNQILRCTINGHAFDFNADLGAIAIGKGAACTPCMDLMFSSKEALQPNGEQPWKRSKARPVVSK